VRPRYNAGNAHDPEAERTSIDTNQAVGLAMAAAEQIVRRPIVIGRDG
jgi:hypothetical protein